MPNRISRQKALLYLAIVTVLLVGCDLGNSAPVTFEPGLPTVLPRTSVTLVPAASPTATLTPFVLKSFAPIAGGAPKLVGAGASLPTLLYTSYFHTYAAQYKTEVDYYATDSGLGIRQFGSKAVDFAGTDIPLTDTQMVSPTIQGGVVQHIPTAIGGLAIVYNLPNAGARLRFSANTLADIYRGAITSWSDPLIAADNPSLALPSQPIVVLQRADYSGSNYIFSRYLTAHNDNFRYAVGASANPHWPAGSGVQDSFSMALAVKQKQYSIGYVSLAYAVDNNLSFADIENKAGNFVTPSPQAFANAAATITSVPDDLRINLVDPPGWTSYPLTGFTWLLVYRDQTDLPKAIATTNLLRWILDVGQASNAAHQFAPLPPLIATRADLLIQQLNVNGTAVYGTGFKPSPTPDPTVTVTGTPPTATPTASQTPSQTVTLIPIASSTPLATDTPNLLPTNAPPPPTDTPQPPTNTPQPPTNTPLPPTNTPLPPSTNTPAPPPPTDTRAGPPPTDTPRPPPPPRPRPTPTELRVILGRATMDNKELVKVGYDRIAAEYLTTRNEVQADVRLLDELVARLPAGAAILDAGCGAGVPVSCILSCHFAVTGVDFSEVQVKLAQQLVPEATFICGDITALNFAAASFDAICSYYAIIHIPREQHAALLRDFYRLLKPSGLALLCLGANDILADIDDYHGEKMYWSHYDTETNLQLLQAAGFALIWTRLVTDSTYPTAQHLFVLAQKPRGE